MGERGPEQITPLRAGPQPGAKKVHVHLDLRNAIFLGGARQVANELASMQVRVGRQPTTRRHPPPQQVR